MESLPDQIYTDFKEYLPQMAEYLGTTTDKVLEVGMRYVWVDIVYNFFLLILLFVFCFAYYKLVRYIISEREYLYKKDIEVPIIGVGIMIGIPIIISTVCGIIKLPSLIIKGLIIPEIRLFELLTKLIK